jgi:hypothetical protein
MTNLKTLPFLSSALMYCPCYADEYTSLGVYAHKATLLSRVFSFCLASQGQGPGYITTNNQSVSMSWYRAQSRTIDQSLLSPWNFI